MQSKSFPQRLRIPPTLRFTRKSYIQLRKIGKTTDYVRTFDLITKGSWNRLSAAIININRNLHQIDPKIWKKSKLLTSSATRGGSPTTESSLLRQPDGFVHRHPQDMVFDADNQDRTTVHVVKIKKQTSSRFPCGRTHRRRIRRDYHQILELLRSWSTHQSLKRNSPTPINFSPSSCIAALLFNNFQDRGRTPLSWLFVNCRNLQRIHCLIYPSRCSTAWVREKILCIWLSNLWIDHHIKFDYQCYSRRGSSTRDDTFALYSDIN